jgi:hypothetical protein
MFLIVAENCSKLGIRSFHFSFDYWLIQLTMTVWRIRCLTLVFTPLTLIFLLPQCHLTKFLVNITVRKRKMKRFVLQTIFLLKLLSYSQQNYVSVEV